MKTAAMIVGGITVLVAVVLLTPIKPSYVTDSDHVNMLKRQANLRTTASSVMNFPSTTADGSFPVADQYGEALMHFNDVWPEPIFGDDDTQDLIWICPFPWPDRRIPDDITREELAKIPLLHERVDLNPDATSVAFWDGHVELLSNEEFERLVDVEQSVCLACEFAIPELMKRRGP